MRATDHGSHGMSYYLTDFRVLTAGIGTSVVGTGVTVADVQTVLGIVAALCGIALTCATFYWRYAEHKRKMRDKDDSEGTQD